LGCRRLERAVIPGSVAAWSSTTSWRSNKDVEVKIDHRMLDDAKVNALVAAALRKF
jgi:hypothetical protein